MKKVFAIILLVALTFNCQILGYAQNISNRETISIDYQESSEIIAYNPETLLFLPATRYWNTPVSDTGVSPGLC